MLIHWEEGRNLGPFSKLWECETAFWFGFPPAKGIIQEIISVGLALVQVFTSH